MPVIDRPAADWHPEPDLVDFASPSARPALERLGEATWKEALDWLYGQLEAWPELAGYGTLCRVPHCGTGC